MFSNIFEIGLNNFPKSNWTNDETIATDYNETIDGIDYWHKLNKEKRIQTIDEFFLRIFPHVSFRIVSNKPEETACIEFIGDIKALNNEWKTAIQEATSKLAKMEMKYFTPLNVICACKYPFNLDTKFYLKDTNNDGGYTGSADSFMSMLNFLSNENEQKPFKLYVGQVFTYHH